MCLVIGRVRLGTDVIIAPSVPPKRGQNKHRVNEVKPNSQLVRHAAIKSRKIVSQAHLTMDIQSGSGSARHLQVAHA
jgi:hypothetical protein